MDPDGSTEFGGNGNTNKLPPKRPTSKINWFFTWNNYPSDWKEIFGSKPFFEKFAIQEETGEECGTKHLQGCVKLDAKRRATQFKLPKQIHWEGCKDWDAAVAYCTKEDTRTGEIYLKGITLKKPLKLINPTYEWEQNILNIIKEDPDDRKIFWYWSKEGGRGKTQFAKYLAANHNAVPLDGKKNDILYCAAMFYSDIYTLILSRDQEHYVSYDALEKIKDGFFMCAKYESKPIVRNPPHVFVFANFPPEESRMSSDRWVITQLD